MTLHGSQTETTNSRINLEIGNQYNGLTLQTVSLKFNQYLEHFIVWMRTAGLPSFRKLYGAINEDLTPGTYYFKINNIYDVSSFSGTKKIVLSTTNALGGQNYFLAIAYIVVGAICMILALIFFGVFMSKRNDRHKNAN